MTRVLLTGRRQAAEELAFHLVSEHASGTAISRGHDGNALEHVYQHTLSPAGHDPAWRGWDEHKIERFLEELEE